MMSEVKMFTKFENLRKERAGLDLANVLNHHQLSLPGLPLLLGYKVGRDVSEIMMTHGGDCLENWVAHMESPMERVDFAAEMLRQILSAFKTLHGLGYAHSDIKPENICARLTKRKQLKFTLIDFGLCQKLTFEKNAPIKRFRGN